jgi:uncharacterized membrane protein
LKQFECQVCRNTKGASEIVPAALVRPAVVEIIRKEHAGWNPDGYICTPDLNAYREKYVLQLLEADKGELSHLEEEVARSIREQDILSRNPNEEYEGSTSLGGRAADRVASFGGSWRFVILFGLFILVWIGINAVWLLKKPFDPYPYILLNLILSCLAAIQAPIIMMSQNRLEAKDRIRAENDYRTNLKAELEIRHLNTKFDQLVNHQWQRLLEIQGIQLEIMEQLGRDRGSG